MRRDTGGQGRRHAAGARYLATVAATASLSLGQLGRYAPIGSATGLRISRWMPPQPTQRMVQYSELARPGMMRNTVRRPLQSGHLERTGARAWRTSLRLMIVTRLPPPPSGGPFLLE